MSLFEELVECGARVLYLGNSGSRFAFNSLAGFKQRTFVALLLFRDALGNRFAALKSGAGIETNTVLAGVQIAVTLWALSVKSNPVNLNVDHCSA